MKILLDTHVFIWLDSQPEKLSKMATGLPETAISELQVTILSKRYADGELPALFVSGGTYFFTVSLRRRNLRQLVESIDLLRLAFRKTLEAKPFQIDAMVAIESNCLSWLFSVRKNTLSHINLTLKTKHSYSQVKDAIQQPCKPFKA